MISSISALINVVYSVSTGAVPKGNWRHSRERFSMMVIHVDAICSFACIRWYAVSRSVSPIRMLLDGYLIGVATIMWSILRR